MCVPPFCLYCANVFFNVYFNVFYRMFAEGAGGAYPSPAEYDIISALGATARATPAVRSVT